MCDLTQLSKLNMLYLNQCDVISPDILSDTESHLLAIFRIGKDNHLPLMTYLMDAYNRFCIHSLKSLILFRLHRHKKYHIKTQFKRISESKFVNKICQNLKLESKIFRNICVKSMKYIMDPRRMSKPSMNNLSIYRINDSIDYSFCILESHLFVAQFMQQSIVNNTNQLPLQFDIWIIPQNVLNVEDNWSSDNNADNIGDIDAKLLDNNIILYINI